MNRILLASCFAVIFSSCQKGTDSKAITESAQFFIENGGLSVVSTDAQSYERPCLDPVNLKLTLLSRSGLGTSPALIDFIQAHKLADVKREARPSGYEGVTITPVAPYQSNWATKGEYGNFCFGTVKLLKAEAVSDAKPITAGTSEPYVIPGTEARATRITFLLDDIPEGPSGSFTTDLKANESLLTRGSMRPEDYGKEFTVIGTIPTKVENYKK
ncbi:hypothetical protein [Deinococcus sp. SL84]|uniref:hypothetical protein n=1 Tax=Deinococcus sp. SL84 TaxID=2994663 RepID=UPI002272CF6C|nr:hypothetical protein [Deinococcus sp. SL84]MCY1703988.1 hypothetical protein [Deinococcus sp. SL84]